MEQLIECISSRMKLNEFFWSWMRLREASHLFLLQEALYTCSFHDLSQEEFVFPNVNGYSSLMQERWKEPLIQIFCLKTTRSRKLLLALLPVVSDFSHLESGIIQKKWNLYSSHGILHHLQGIICMRKGFKHCKMHLIELWAVISGWKQVKLANICNKWTHQGSGWCVELCEWKSIPIVCKSTYVDPLDTQTNVADSSLHHSVPVLL